MRLIIHRAELVKKDKKYQLEKVPEKDQCNMGVKYTLGFVKRTETEGRILGWRTGYPVGQRYDEGPTGTAYAPEGFAQGNIVYIDLQDELLTASKRDNKNIEELIENLGKAPIDQQIEQLQGFSLVGIIDHCL